MRIDDSFEAYGGYPSEQQSENSYGQGVSYDTGDIPMLMGSSFLDHALYRRMAEWQTQRDAQENLGNSDAAPENSDLKQQMSDVERDDPWLNRPRRLARRREQMQAEKDAENERRKAELQAQNDTLAPWTKTNESRDAEIATLLKGPESLDPDTPFLHAPDPPAERIAKKPWDFLGRLLVPNIIKGMEPGRPASADNIAVVGDIASLLSSVISPPSKTALAAAPKFPTVAERPQWASRSQIPNLMTLGQLLVAPFIQIPGAGGNMTS